MADHVCKASTVGHRLEDGERVGNQGTWVYDYVYGICDCGAHVHETLSNKYVRWD